MVHLHVIDIADGPLCLCTLYLFQAIKVIYFNFVKENVRTQQFVSVRLSRSLKNQHFIFFTKTYGTYACHQSYKHPNTNIYNCQIKVIEEQQFP